MQLYFRAYFLSWIVCNPRVPYLSQAVWWKRGFFGAPFGIVVLFGFVPWCCKRLLLHFLFFSDLFMLKLMSSRAEGCGLWLSTKEKRSTQLPLQKSGKAKKSKQKFLLCASSKRSNGLDIRVSSSPLSPRSRKKLQNAKQTKINKYFGSETYSKDSRRGNILEGVSERAGCFEGKLLAKISVKRKQKENTSDTGK